MIHREECQEKHYMPRRTPRRIIYSKKNIRKNKVQQEEHSIARRTHYDKNNTKSTALAGRILYSKKNTEKNNIQ